MGNSKKIKTEPIQEELIPVEETSENKNIISYIPSPFIAASLPLKNINKNVFVRKYNNITLRLTGGLNVPYGKYGRLLLTVLTTHAVIEKESDKGQVVFTYKSIRNLLNELQLSSGRNNEIKAQLDYFANSSFIFEEKVMKVTQRSLFKDLLEGEDAEAFGDSVTATKVSTGSIPFIEALQYIELSDEKGDAKQLGISIKLSQSFVQFSRKHSVPIDYSAYKEISSAVGKDLYAWLVYRNNSLTEPLYITREALVKQFMPVTNPNDRNQERGNFDYIKNQISIIKRDYYPDLKVTFDKDNLGITLYKSKPQIQSNDTRYVLVTSEN